MDVITSTLNGIDGGRVLDVATRAGHFVQVLKTDLHSYAEIVGIDLDPTAIEMAKNTFENERIQFMVMNAEKLEFQNESFDTVSLSASLHHMANIPPVLHEMKRVLKPGGHFIIVEMHGSGQTAAELTFIYLHQWVAAVDTALGQLHNRPLARAEIISLVTALELSQVEYYDGRDQDTDPLEPTRIKPLVSLIERTIRRAEDTSRSAELKQRGRELHRRLHEVGVQKEPILLVVGKK